MIEFTAEEIKNGQVLLFDKPYKWTSFQLVNKVRWLLCRKHGWKKLKVGHAGTLDPLATGLMILCTGKATKQIMELTGFDKEYVTEIKFGETTPSFDLETEVNNTYSIDNINTDSIQKQLLSFLGEIDQVPPLFSAKYVNGTRAYHLARQGIEAELKPSKIKINEFELLNYNEPFGNFRINCSKGTYIRSLARDLGEKLNSGAHLTSLKRTSIADFKLVDAISIEEFENNINLM
jgi:tRNA pseudouridine55 synthase